ncbi:uncharacterized protein BDR25DRAFT_191953, partial [Lindgomyces ingoldianus]
SFWYKPSERLFRLGTFKNAHSLASTVSGFLARTIDHLNYHEGPRAKQWMFIIKGALPITLIVFIYFLLLACPEPSTALSDRDRYIAINR